MTTEICILARTNSKRLPKKALIDIQGKPTIWHLWNRVSQSEYKVTVCVPENDTELINVLEQEGIEYFQGSADNPLERMVEFCEHNNLDDVIRITHDDLFIDVKIMHKMAKYHRRTNNDYTYTALIPDGCGCEIFKASALKGAYEKNKGINIEGVSNYFRNDDYKVDQYRPEYSYQYPNYRVTLDYPEDLVVAKLLFEQMPFSSSQINSLDIINHLKKHPSIRDINRLPKVSIYIPNYNYGKFLDVAIMSALSQTYQDIEVVVVDDCSTDNSIDVLKKYMQPDSRVRVFLNDENIGLPATANKAISLSRGKYIVRIDADDMLLPDCVERLLESTDDDIAAVYGGYILCDKEMNVSGGVKRLPPFNTNENEYHPTGALVNRRYYNDIKYDEKLKGFESYDFFKRVTKSFKICLTTDILWLKREHDCSMMNSNKESRAKLKEEINGRY